MLDKQRAAAVLPHVPTQDVSPLRTGSTRSTSGDQRHRRLDGHNVATRGVMLALRNAPEISRQGRAHPPTASPSLPNTSTEPPHPTPYTRNATPATKPSRVVYPNKSSNLRCVERHLHKSIDCDQRASHRKAKEDETKQTTTCQVLVPPCSTTPEAHPAHAMRAPLERLRMPEQIKSSESCGKAVHHALPKVPRGCSPGELRSCPKVAEQSPPCRPKSRDSAQVRPKLTSLG